MGEDKDEDMPAHLALAAVLCFRIRWFVAVTFQVKYRLVKACNNNVGIILFERTHGYVRSSHGVSAVFISSRRENLFYGEAKRCN